MCEYLYTLREDWEQVLECYINDTSRHSQIFQLLVNIFDKFSSSSPKRIKDFESAILNHVQVLDIFDDPTYQHWFDLYIFDFQVPD